MTVANLTAEQFLSKLHALRSDDELEKIQRYFKIGKGQYAEGDRFIGVRMGDVFTLAKQYMDLPEAEIEHLLESPIHEARAGAMSIMDKCARRKKTTPERRAAMFDLYLRRHDRINNWDLVDLAAIHVIGGYLYDRDRTILYDMAHSDNVWERRTSIVSTAFFIRMDELDDTYAIAEILLEDEHDLIQKAVGGWLRESGKRDRDRLLNFLETNADKMPRTMLRYATEHFDQEVRDRLRSRQ